MSWHEMMKHHTTSLGNISENGGGGAIAATGSSRIGILATTVL